MRRSLTAVLAACLAIASNSAAAQAPSVALTADAAQAIIEGCKAHAEGKGQSHAIAVYDSGAYPVASLRMEGNRAGMMAFAMEKAKAVAMWGFATSDMENGAKDTPGFANAPGVVTVAGGVPIFSGDGKTLIGGVGASGEAPEDDAACAEAGISAAGLASKRIRG